MWTREIPEARWAAFFDRFSKVFRDRRVSVETTGGDVGVLCNVRNLPLLGVTAERNALDGPWSIEIMTGSSPEAHVTHVVTAPLRVRVADWRSETFSAVLQIEAAGGWTTLLYVGNKPDVLPPGFVTDERIRSTAAAPG